MLAIAEEHVSGARDVRRELLRPAVNADADIHVLGQGVNGEPVAIWEVEAPYEVGGRVRRGGGRLRQQAVTRAARGAGWDYRMADAAYGYRTGGGPGRGGGRARPQRGRPLRGGRWRASGTGSLVCVLDKCWGTSGNGRRAARGSPSS